MAPAIRGPGRIRSALPNHLRATRNAGAMLPQYPAPPPRRHHPGATTGKRIASAIRKPGNPERSESSV